jgi:hypothetical protein
MLSGSLSADGKTFVLHGKVAGDQLQFNAGGKDYHGRLNGKNLEIK